MPLRPPAGFIRPGFDPLKNPNAPTIGTATGGDASASVTFTAPANVGGSAISAYYAVSNPGQITSSGASSPVTVSGLTNGTAYTFTVWALNTFGPGPFSAASGSVTPAAARGVFGGGYSSGAVNVIDYINIGTTGNATDFGDLTLARYNIGACSSSTRGVFGGGNDSSNRSNVLDYVTIATTGNAIDFGDILAPTDTVPSGCGSSTRGIFGGGFISGGYTNVIQYITIASVGNAIDFGDLIDPTGYSGACSSTTRGVWAGGDRPSGSGGVSAVIAYVTIASTGNATNFGNLPASRSGLAGCSNSTRGLFGGGGPSSTSSNIIEYITIATTGNATDFGDLTINVFGVAGAASSTRATFAGGYDSSFVRQNVIAYVTIATTGNATDFGDLTVARDGLAGCSNAHGGL